MHWIIVTDANGNDFHALTASQEDTVDAFVFFDKESGFGNNVGSVDFHKNLKRRSDGKYGA